MKFKESHFQCTFLDWWPMHLFRNQINFTGLYWWQDIIGSSTGWRSGNKLLYHLRKKAFKQISVNHFLMNSYSIGQLKPTKAYLTLYRLKRLTCKMVKVWPNQFGSARRLSLSIGIRCKMTRMHMQLRLLLRAYPGRILQDRFFNLINGLLVLFKYTCTYACSHGNLLGKFTNVTCKPTFLTCCCYVFLAFICYTCKRLSYSKVDAYGVMAVYLIIPWVLLAHRIHISAFKCLTSDTLKYGTSLSVMGVYES